MDDHKIDCRAQGHTPLKEQIPTPLIPCQCGNQDAIVTGLHNIQQLVQNLLQRILFEHQSQQIFQTQPPQRQHDANGLGCSQLHSTSTQFAPTLFDQDKSMGTTTISKEDLSQNGNVVGVDGIPVKVYQDLLERALKVESIVKMPDRSQNCKRTWSESQKGNIMETPTANKKVATEYPQCNKCFKRHLGECKMQLGLCFKCGELGHFARNWPAPNKPTTTDKTEGMKNEGLESSQKEVSQGIVPTSTSTNQGEKEDGSAA